MHMLSGWKSPTNHLRVLLLYDLSVLCHLVQRLSQQPSHSKSRPASSRFWITCLSMPIVRTGAVMMQSSEFTSTLSRSNAYSTARPATDSKCDQEHLVSAAMEAYASHWTSPKPLTRFAEISSHNPYLTTAYPTMLSAPCNSCTSLPGMSFAWTVSPATLLQHAASNKAVVLRPHSGSVLLCPSWKPCSSNAALTGYKGSSPSLPTTSAAVGPSNPPATYSEPSATSSSYLACLLSSNLPSTCKRLPSF